MVRSGKGEREVNVELKTGREKRKDGRLEGWKAGRIEEKNGRMEGWKDGKPEGGKGMVGSKE